MCKTFCKPGACPWSRGNRCVSSPLRGGVSVQHTGALHPRPHGVHPGAQRLLLERASAALHTLRNPEHEETPKTKDFRATSLSSSTTARARVFLLSAVRVPPSTRGGEESPRARPPARTRAHTQTEEEEVNGAIGGGRMKKPFKKQFQEKTSRIFSEELQTKSERAAILSRLRRFQC